MFGLPKNASFLAATQTLASEAPSLFLSLIETRAEENENLLLYSRHVLNDHGFPSPSGGSREGRRGKGKRMKRMVR